MSYSGQQGRLGATLALEEINAAGIKSLGGAKIEPVFGDAQSTPEGGNAEVEKMNAAGCAAVVGGYVSSICLAASQTAARYDLPYIVDVGVADSIVTRGLKNTFRFGPGFGVHRQDRDRQPDHAQRRGRQDRQDRDDRARGLRPSAPASPKLLNTQLPEKGFQVIETIPHPTPTRDFNNVVTKIRASNPDLVIPANYYNEYVLLARTMQQQKVRPKAIYSVLGGAASSYKFVKEFPEAAQYIMDCNHWFDPKNPKALDLKKKVEAKGEFFTYEVYMNYSAVLLLADALERAASADRAKIIAALGDLDLLGPRDAVRADQVRQRAEPGRGAGEHAGARQRHPGDLPGGVRVGEAGVPDAGVSFACRCEVCAARAGDPLPLAGRGWGWGSRCDLRDQPPPSRRALFRRGEGAHRPRRATHALPHHPRSGHPQRAADRRRLCAGRARPDADLRRAAHHQFRARRAAHRRDVRGVLRPQAARA